MNPTDRFSHRVENYVRYRPDYPPQVVEFMRVEMGLNKNSIVADIGSGTGIFAKQLLETGCTVYGVEPNAAMRDAGEKFLKDFPNFKSINGTAENANLPNASVDFVTAAQAFHWFDEDKSIAEFRRILKPEGYAVLIWNNRQLDSTPFLREYEQFILDFGTDYHKVRFKNDRELFFNQFLQNNFSERIFYNEQEFDFEGLKGRWLSASYAPLPSHPRFEETMTELNHLFARHQTDDKVKILYDTHFFYRKF